MKYGRFSEDDVEYIIINPSAPRPWINYVYFVPPVEAESIIPSYVIEGTLLGKDNRVTDFGRIIPAQME